MKDTFNPTYEEIKNWAYSSEPSYPEQDWDIIVFDRIDDVKLTSLTLEIASDTDCPKQDSFIHFLNIMTGTVARFAAKNGFEEKKLKKLNELILKAEKSSSQLVLDWANRSKKIIQSPETFRYEDWF